MPRYRAVKRDDGSYVHKPDGRQLMALVEERPRTIDCCREAGLEIFAYAHISDGVYRLDNCPEGAKEDFKKEGWFPLYRLAPTPMSAPIVSEWRDIRTAPRDGTWFLAASTQEGWKAMRLTSFRHKDDRLPTNGEGVIWPSAPTHWMPLPAYPTPAPLPE